MLLLLFGVVVVLLVFLALISEILLEFIAAAVVAVAVVTVLATQLYFALNGLIFRRGCSRSSNKIVDGRGRSFAVLLDSLSSLTMGVLEIVLREMEQVESRSSFKRRRRGGERSDLIVEGGHV